MDRTDIFSNCKSGIDFETRICNMLIEMGLDAKRVGKSDKGVDVIATTPAGYTFNIQCKFHNKSIDNSSVNQVFGGTAYYDNGGAPVVITNNTATAEARLVAKKLKVEIIADAEWVELQQVYNSKRIINHHQGLMGMIISYMVGNANYLAIENTRDKLTPQQHSEIEQFKLNLVTMFDEAEIHMKEAISHQLKAAQHQQCAIALQKEVLLKNIDAGIENILSGGLPMSMLFNEILDSLGTLTEEQKAELKSKLASLDEKPEGQLKSNENKPPACPICKSTNVKKIGFTSAGVQRYQCKECKDRFTETSDTMLFRSKLTPEQWDGLLLGIVQNLSTTKIAKTIGIKQPTVWTNRRKVLAALASLYGVQDEKFLDIAECDEYYTPVSFKGKRDPEFFIKVLGRMPRHHRTRMEMLEYLEENGLLEALEADPERLEMILHSSNTYKRGISNEQACVLTCKDRQGNLYINPICVGHPETADIQKELSGKFASDAILVTDSNSVYPSFAHGEGIQHEQIPSGKHAKGAFNLSRVNAVHSKLAKQIPEDSGRAPATKYLDYNTVLFWWLEDNSHLSVTEKVNKLKEIISTPQNLGKLDAKTLSQKELTINTKGLFPTKV